MATFQMANQRVTVSPSAPVMVLVSEVGVSSEVLLAVPPSPVAQRKVNGPVVPVSVAVTENVMVPLLPPEPCMPERIQTKLTTRIEIRKSGWRQHGDTGQQVART